MDVLNHPVRYFDKDSSLQAVRKNGGSLQFVTKEFKNDREVVLEAVKEYGRSLQFASEELRNDKEVVLEAVRQNGYCLEFASQELKNDREVVMEAVKQNGYSIKFSSERMKNDKEIVLESVKMYGDSLQHASEELKNDRDVVLESVKQYGDSLEYASDELRNDTEVVIEAVKKFGCSLEYASETLRNNREFVLEAVKLNGYSFNYTIEEMKNDKEILLEAVKQNESFLKHASEELKNDKEVLHYCKLSRQKDRLSSKISSENEFVIQYFAQKGNISFSKQRLKKVVGYFIQRSDLYFEMKVFEKSILDIQVSFQLSSLGEKTSELVNLRDTVSKKAKRILEEIVKSEIASVNSNPFENIISVVYKNLKRFIDGYSWMESEELIPKEDRVFQNEWKENMVTEMKKSIFMHINSDVTREFPEMLKITNNVVSKIHSYTSERYIQGCKFEYVNYNILQDTINEFEKILTEALSPLFLLTSLFEKDLQIVDLKPTSTDTPKTTTSDSPSNPSIRKYIGFVDKNLDRYGFGLEYGEFSGGLFSRTVICRRLYYGKIKNGLRHGKRCEEYSPKDGSLIFCGNFQNGRREGKGIEYSLSNRRTTGGGCVHVQIFEGEYRDGKRHGEGEEYDQVTGEVVRGTWRIGILDESTVFRFECPIFKFEDFRKKLKEINQVGKGGFGVVYRLKSSVLKSKFAQRIKKEKFVAVKIMESRSNRDKQLNLRMIRRGIGFCYSIKSKHVLESYGIIKGEKVGYVMKLCEKSIYEVIEDGKIMMEEKIRIMKETALGIKALHDRNLIHRDLKWKNVLMDFNGVVKLTDFDTVKDDELQWRMKKLYQTSRIGTAGCRPPEVIHGNNYSSKCDIYSFGLMIYSLLFEKNLPYITQSHCSCGKKVHDIIRNGMIENHILVCNLRPLMNSDQVANFPPFLVPVIDLMVQSWDRNPFNRPSIEDFLFVMKSRKVYKITFQFPTHPGVRDQTMFLIKPFGVKKLVDWIEKKFEKPIIQEKPNPENNMKKTKVIHLDSALGSVHSDEVVEKILETELSPSVDVTLNNLDESYVLDPEVNQKISVEEHEKVLKRVEELEEENKHLRMKMLDEIESRRIEKKHFVSFLEKNHLYEKFLEEYGNEKFDSFHVKKEEEETEGEESEM